MTPWPRSAGARRWIVLAGPAGSGKTEALRALARRGEQVIDLERLAAHRGSAFGAIDGEQPTHRAFQRAVRRAVAGADPRRVVWVEHEARSIGKVGIPDEIARRWADADFVQLDVPLPRRVARIVQDYGSTGAALLPRALSRVARRLGEARASRAAELLEAGRLEGAAELLLGYYDDAYAHQATIRRGRRIAVISEESGDPEAIADGLIALMRGDRESVPKEGVEPRRPSIAAHRASIATPCWPCGTRRPP